MGSSVMLNGVEYAGEQIAYKDSTYELISKVAFLIGVPQRIFENEHEAPQLDVYERLSKDKYAISASSGLPLNVIFGRSMILCGWNIADFCLCQRLSLLPVCSSLMRTG